MQKVPHRRLFEFLQKQRNLSKLRVVAHLELVTIIVVRWFS